VRAENAAGGRPEVDAQRDDENGDDDGGDEHPAFGAETGVGVGTDAGAGVGAHRRERRRKRSRRRDGNGVDGWVTDRTGVITDESPRR
jgi:hypothetical protein